MHQHASEVFSGLIAARPVPTVVGARATICRCSESNASTITVLKGCPYAHHAVHHEYKQYAPAPTLPSCVFLPPPPAAEPVRYLAVHGASKRARL